MILDEVSEFDAEGIGADVDGGGGDEVELGMAGVFEGEEDIGDADGAVDVVDAAEGFDFPTFEGFLEVRPTVELSGVEEEEGEGEGEEGEGGFGMIFEDGDGFEVLSSGPGEGDLAGIGWGGMRWIGIIHVVVLSWKFQGVEKNTRKNLLRLLKYILF